MISHFPTLDNPVNLPHNRTIPTIGETPMIDLIRAGKFEIPVLYEDNHLLVVVKPANLPTQADSIGDQDLLTLLKNYIGNKYQKPGNVYMGLVHRLDRPVGGVMVFARTSKAAARLSDAFANHTQDRQYFAILQGELREKRTLEDELLKDGKTGMVSAVKPGTPGAKHAKLDTAPIAVREGLTLTRVQLYTGRSHQIRVQHAHAGHPLWGDARYGGGKPGQQIALWAVKLAFKHPTKDEFLTFTYAPPAIGAWKHFSGIIESELGE